MLSKVTVKGGVVGVIAWLAIMNYAVHKSACFLAKSCGGDDLLIFAVLGVGMLGPSYLAAMLASDILK